jgi:hypothetical protein
MVAVYAPIDRHSGTDPDQGNGVQQQTTRSSDFGTLAFVIALFGLLLALTLVLGAPLA